MSLNDNLIKQTTKDICTEGISNFVDGREESNTLFQILDLLIPHERKIRSIVGGLETGLGVTFWEPLVLALARLNNFQIIDQDLNAPNCPDTLIARKSIVINHRSEIDGTYDSMTSKNAINQIWIEYLENNHINKWHSAPRGKGVDIWLKKDNIHYLYDTKTVQPNVGSLNNFLKQIHDWYFYFFSKYPHEQIVAKIIFPYNPYNNEDFYDRCKGRGRPLEHPNETECGNTFWPFITGNENAYDLIIEAIRELGENRTIANKINSIFD